MKNKYKFDDEACQLFQLIIWSLLQQEIASADGGALSPSLSKD
jgi:hypothetical protein